MPTVAPFCHVTVIVILMITGHQNHLPVVVRCPIPEIHLRGDGVAQVEGIASQNKDIGQWFKRFCLDVMQVLSELQVEITHVLDLHSSAIFAKLG